MSSQTYDNLSANVCAHLFNITWLLNGSSWRTGYTLVAVWSVQKLHLSYPLVEFRSNLAVLSMEHLQNLLLTPFNHVSFDATDSAIFWNICQETLYFRSMEVSAVTDESKVLVTKSMEAGRKKSTMKKWRNRWSTSDSQMLVIFTVSKRTSWSKRLSLTHLRA